LTEPTTSQDNPIEINLTAIAEMAHVRLEENKQFHLFLKAKYGGFIDADIIRIAGAVATKVNCLECGNCCKTLQPSVLREEQARIAENLAISQTDFVQNYLDPYEDAFFEGCMLMKAEPCKLLNEDLTCRVYGVRPRDCHSFPHLDKKDFVARYGNLIDYYGVCPIVYHSIEELKEFTEFHSNQL
jgi:hypothetical protein